MFPKNRDFMNNTDSKIYIINIVKKELKFKWTNFGENTNNKKKGLFFLVVCKDQTIYEVDFSWA